MQGFEWYCQHTTVYYLLFYFSLFNVLSKHIFFILNLSTVLTGHRHICDVLTVTKHILWHILSSTASLKSLCIISSVKWPLEFDISNSPKSTFELMTGSAFACIHYDTAGVSFLEQSGSGELSIFAICNFPPMDHSEETHTSEWTRDWNLGGKAGLFLINLTSCVL